MIHKDFLSYKVVRNNAIKLVHSIEESGFRPDVIYILLRGGAYMGNVFSEYYKVIQQGEKPVFYAAVVARSYSDVRQQSKVQIDGWTYSPDLLRRGDKILLVDDIFDTGVTLNYLTEEIMSHGIPREDIKIAVHDYKVTPFKGEPLPIQPDFYCRKHRIESQQDEEWIHYVSHELIGLTKEEIFRLYNTDEEVQNILLDLLHPEKD